MRLLPNTIRIFSQQFTQVSSSLGLVIRTNEYKLFLIILATRIGYGSLLTSCNDPCLPESRDLINDSLPEVVVLPVVDDDHEHVLKLD